MSSVPSPNGNSFVAEPVQRLPPLPPNVGDRLAAGADPTPQSSPPAVVEAPNPFDPARLRLSQDFATTIGVKKMLNVVPVRKPHRHEWVRVRPGADWRLETGVFEDKVQRETYLVDRPLWGEMLGEITPTALFTAITKQGDLLLWPVKLPGADGKSNTWNESALAAATLAQTHWTRVAANMAAGMYDTYQAAAELSEPEWPDKTFTEILELGFRTRFIKSMDHPVIRQLRGEV